MATKPSSLTKLTEQRSAAELQQLSRDSFQWLIKKINELRKPAPTLAREISREKTRWVQPSNRQRFLIGGMYFFYYNPKNVSTLPYYDQFPLVIPIKREADGFLGLNLHYLPLRYRSFFLRKLLDLAVYDENDELVRLRVTYPLLDASARYKEFRPCIKKYLYTQINSRILKVESGEWDVATYLPVHQFRKEKATNIWQDSVDEIRKP